MQKEERETLKKKLLLLWLNTFRKGQADIAQLARTPATIVETTDKSHLRQT